MNTVSWNNRARKEESKRVLRAPSTDTATWSPFLRVVCCLAILTFCLAVPHRAGAAFITVTSTGDSGPGTLRDAVETANAGDAIDFSLPPLAAITLTSGQIVIDK